MFSECRNIYYSRLLVVLYRVAQYDGAAKHVENAQHGVDERYGTAKGVLTRDVFNRNEVVHLIDLGDLKDPLTTKPATLFEFRTADDLGMWKTFADSVFGGKSSAMLEHNGPLQKFASFRGVYSREIGEKASPRLKRSGFVGMTGRYNGLYIDLESYQSVVYRVRGDGRAYLANIRTDNWVVGDTAEDIWQAVLLSSGNSNKENNGWEDVEVPLDAFVLTWRGKVVEQPVEMNRTKVTGMGISLLGNDEQKEGPYNLDIEWIKARHFSDGAPGMPLGGE